MSDQPMPGLDWWVYRGGGRVRFNFTDPDTERGGTVDMPAAEAERFFGAGLAIAQPSRWRRALRAWRGRR